jgi:SAM-dependent MidA family methyltransferase
VSEEETLRDVLRKSLQEGDLPFRDFVELALYHPRLGYYARGQNPIGKDADYVTAPLLSPVFSYALSKLVRDFVGRCEAEVISIVDIGSGDGSLISALAENQAENVRFFGVDRSQSRWSGGLQPTEALGSRVPSARWAEARRSTDLAEIPRDGAHLILSNELYDAFPFARLVKRGERIHELCVTERDGALDWSEREGPPAYERYFADRGIELTDGQFADVSLEWEAFHADVLRFISRGLVVTIDYGYPAAKLFHPRARRFGTAAAYAGQRVSRDLLANPGEQDLTAHINFGDLERAGAREGATTLFFDRLAKFLLTLDITSHELFRPVHEVSIANAAEGVELIQAREDARRLVLPDGIGEEMRVLVQAKGIAAEGWAFQRTLF